MFEAAKKRMEEREKEKAKRDKKRIERKKLAEEKRLAKKKKNSELYQKARELAGNWRDVEEVKSIYRELKKKND